MEDRRIAILICTHDRPQFLAKLLEALRHQCRPGVFVAIADNGIHSAEPIIARFAAELDLVYRRIEEPGLVVARNACLALALGQDPDILAFIDDDEIPTQGWLAALVAALEQTGADFVTGPVEPTFMAPPPHWAVAGDFFRPDGHSFRTSNLALRRKCLPPDPDQWFQMPFNRMGGEDAELLNRLVKGGAVHQVATRAVVTEFVPPERLRRRYIWRCGFRDGVIIAETAFSGQVGKAGALLSCLREAAWKLAYALNHLFWAARAPWRSTSAIRDISAAAGIAVAMSGIKPSFYGNPPPPAVEAHP